MQLSERLEAFCRLGEHLTTMPMPERKALAAKAKLENPWFVEENVLMALQGISRILERKGLHDWVQDFKEPSKKVTVGVAMAGNIPAVGFHDYLCVLMSGHLLQAKLSSQDKVLLTYLHERLLHIEPRFAAQVHFDDQLRGVGASVTTGSDNTARYFEFYFRHIPHVIRRNRTSCAVIQGIRRNRTSCAVIQGDEHADEWLLLGEDVFSYFGLGCRNVSKLYVPQGFQFEPLLDAWQPFSWVAQHHKYVNNYEYQRSLLLMNQTPFLDTGYCLLTESQNLVSPIGMVYYEHYVDQADLIRKIASQVDKLQIVLSAKGWFKGSVPFGKAQYPAVTDYADHVDLMKFLAGL